MLKTSFAHRIVLVTALVFSLIWAPLPRVAKADPHPPRVREVKFAFVLVTAEEAAEFAVGNFSEGELRKRLLELNERSSGATPGDVCDLFEESAAYGLAVPAPVDDNGVEVPPPVVLPPGREGQPNNWVRRPGSVDRPSKWVPKHSVPTREGGQPSASWDDEEGHWDVDNGNGLRTRWLPDGTSIGEDHKPTLKPELPPEPFLGIDPVPYLLIGGAVVLIVVLFFIAPIAAGGTLLLVPSVLLSAIVPIGP